MNLLKQQRLTKVILAPIITEKSTMVGDKVNQVVFRVVKDATKREVKEAVEFLFKVQVKAVNVLNQKGKVKNFARRQGVRSDWKKAYVSLEAGQEINFGVGG